MTGNEESEDVEDSAGVEDSECGECSDDVEISGGVEDSDVEIIGVAEVDRDIEGEGEGGHGQFGPKSSRDGVGEEDADGSGDGSLNRGLVVSTVNDLVAIMARDMIVSPPNTIRVHLPLSLCLRNRLVFSSMNREPSNHCCSLFGLTSTNGVPSAKQKAN